MQRLLRNVKIQIPERLYLKDPESSAVGQAIVSGSVKLIEELGFEDFTFKKLGQAIGSPESTIYRYFRNKHQLLIYLISWYWGWLEYKVVFSTANLNDPREKLRKAIAAISEDFKADETFSHIDEVALQDIVINQSSKAFLTKSVDEENKQGYFTNYKRLSERLSEAVQEADPNYPYPHTLVSTVLESCHLQKFFGKHLPALTDKGQNNEALTEFLTNLTLKQLKDA